MANENVNTLEQEQGQNVPEETQTEEGISSEATETKQEPIETSPEPTATETKPVRTSRRPEGSSKQDWQKSHNELKSYADKEIAKRDKELSELRKYRQEVDPYLSPLKAQYEAQKKAELQAKLQDDPQNALKELVEREIQARLQPIQEREIQAKAAETTNMYRQFLGDDQFTVYAPKMGKVLGEVGELDKKAGVNPSDPRSLSNTLSQNPGWLLAVTFGIEKMNEMQKATQTANAAQVSQQAAQERVKQQISNMSKISQGNGISPTPVTTPDVNQMTTEQLLEHLRKTGAARQSI